MDTPQDTFRGKFEFKSSSITLVMALAPVIALKMRCQINSLKTKNNWSESSTNPLV